MNYERDSKGGEPIVINPHKDDAIPMPAVVREPVEAEPEIAAEIPAEQAPVPQADLIDLQG